MRGGSTRTLSWPVRFFSWVMSSRTCSGRDTLEFSPAVLRMTRHFSTGMIAMLLAAVGAPAFAQTGINIAGYTIITDTQDRLDEKHGLLIGHVELLQGDTQLYADQVEVFEGEDRVIARSN